MIGRMRARNVNDEYFKKITESIPALVSVYNVHTGEYEYVNDALPKLLGYEREEFLKGGVPFAISITHPDDLKRIMDKNADALERADNGLNEFVPFEYRMLHKNGAWHWLHTDGSVFARREDGTVESVLNISLDITEQKNIESALRTTKSEMHALLTKLKARVDEEPSILESIVNSSVDAIVSKSLDGIIRSWNKGAENIFGYSAAEAIGKHISLIIPHDRIDEEAMILGRISAGEDIQHYETERLRKDGRRIAISLTISPIRTANGTIIGASKIARDISDRKRHESLLKEEEKRKDEFLAVLAHELRNPLAPISSAAQILQLKDVASSEALWAVDVIQRQLAHMTRLIDDLLDISRITSNKLELLTQKTEVTEILHSAVEASRPLIDAAKHTFHISLPSKPIAIVGDPVRLAQVVSNLLSNAAKYTPDGGTIWLSAYTEGAHAVITVRDSGIGIPRELQPKIFDMFVQGMRSPNATRGLGIGLTLVKRLLEMHRGTIEVQSKGANFGSTFIVRLPLSRTAPDTQVHTHDEPSLHHSPLRILVVDDNKDALESLEMVLRLQGDITHVAHDGAEAVFEAQKFSPDVVLLDIGMPTMNGYEAARRLRAQPHGENLKIIAVTGWGQNADKERAREAGFDHHLTKPVDAGALSELLLSYRPTTALTR